MDVMNLSIDIDRDLTQKLINRLVLITHDRDHIENALTLMHKKEDMKELILFLDNHPNVSEYDVKEKMFYLRTRADRHTGKNRE